MKAREAEAEAAMGDLAAALMRGGSMPVLAARSVLDALERHDDLMELDASVLEAVQRMDASAQGAVQKEQFWTAVWAVSRGKLHCPLAVYLKRPVGSATCYGALHAGRPLPTRLRQTADREEIRGMGGGLHPRGW